MFPEEDHMNISHWEDDRLALTTLLLSWQRCGTLKIPVSNHNLKEKALVITTLPRVPVVFFLALIFCHVSSSICDIFAHSDCGLRPHQYLAVSLEKSRVRKKNIFMINV